MTSQIFRGKTIAEAKRAAEAALGAGAVVLTTRRIPRPGILGFFGSSLIEVAAMTPTQPAQMAAAPVLAARRPTNSLAHQLFSPGVLRATAEMQAERKDELKRDEVERLRSEFRKEIQVVRASFPKPAVGSRSIETEIASLRESIEQLAPREDQSGTHRISKLLRDRGLERKAAQAITKALKGKETDADHIQESFRDAVADVVKVSQWPLAGEERKLIGLVGPSGVGKTTTAAKLAARAVMEHGRSVTFIACDNSRVGAVEQLRRYASLIDAQFIVATTEEELFSAIESSTADLIIVDTAGRGPIVAGTLEASLGDAQRMGKIKGMSKHVALVLPASIRAVDAERHARDWSACNPTEIIVTKIDETDAPAGLLHGTMSSRGKLPVSTLCFGQRVPEDIAPATRGGILDYIAPHDKRRQVA